MGYRGMVDKQNQARELRAQGWTLGEICERVGCSKSSASLWCKDVELDEVELERRRSARSLAGNEGARRRGPNKLQLRKQAEIAEMRARALELIGVPSERDLLIAGVMLYAGEGSKRDGGVRLANSDPRMIAMFCDWIRRFFSIDESRLRVQLYLHQGLDLDPAIAFWSELTAIPPEQFQKPYRAVPDPSIRRAKHLMGCPAVIYSCARTHRSIMGMIDVLLSSSGSELGCGQRPSL